MDSAPRDLVQELPGRLRLAYRDWGGEGQPVVLLHGLASSYRIWDLMAPLLARRHRVVALDQRAHGRSERPDGDFSFPAYVEDLRAFLDALGFERAVVVGHSWGGNVALQFGVDAPERVEALTLVDGGFLELSARPGWSWERVEQELAPPKLDGIRPEELLSRVSQGDQRRFWRPELGEIVLGHFERTEDGRLRPALRREHHMQILRAMWEHQPSRLWARVQAPVLLVPARRDDVEGRQAEMQRGKEASVAQAERLLRRSETLWLEDTIHDVPLQRPEELAEAIERFAGRAD
jgi:pimeloyl-ACP methyl ester carboxylesterase